MAGATPGNQRLASIVAVAGVALPSSLLHLLHLLVVFLFLLVLLLVLVLADDAARDEVHGRGVVGPLLLVTGAEAGCCLILPNTAYPTQLFVSGICMRSFFLSFYLQP
jgi:hypothetical protein